MWKDVLLPIDRAEWDAYALSCIYSGPEGDYTIPGRLLFTAARGLVDYINNLGLAVVPTGLKAPPETGFYTLADVKSISPPLTVGTGFTLSVQNYGVHQVVAFAEVSNPQNLTRNRMKGPWNTSITQALLIPAASAGLIPVLDLVADKRYFWRLRAVTADTPTARHAITTEWYGSVIADTNPGP
jgi:hypothetical protein